MKKNVARLLAGIVACAVLAGCGVSEQKPEPKPGPKADEEALSEALNS